MEGNEKSVVLTAKVDPTDRQKLLDYAKTFPTVREGFNNIVKKLEAKPEIETVEVEKNMEQVFQFDTYSAFVEPTDTNIADTILRALDYANTAKVNEGLQPIIKGKHVEFTTEIERKLSLLHRFLTREKRIPECTEKEFLNKMFTELVTRHINNNFEFLNRE